MLCCPEYFPALLIYNKNRLNEFLKTESSGTPAAEFAVGQKMYYTQKQTHLTDVFTRVNCK